MAAAIPQSKELFVRRWGEMAAYWGISRTMAEIHALLYLSPNPLCADDIMAELQISRGNASMNLRALLDWALIERVHKPGDRKEYFSGIADVWGIFGSILRQRKRREVEPIIDTIQRCRDLVAEEVARLRGPPAADARFYRQRFDDMLEFLSAIAHIVDLVFRLGPRGLRRVNAMLVRLAG